MVEKFCYCFDLKAGCVCYGSYLSAFTIMSLIINTVLIVKCGIFNGSFTDLTYTVIDFLLNSASAGLLIYAAVKEVEIYLLAFLLWNVIHTALHVTRTIIIGLTHPVIFVVLPIIVFFPYFWYIALCYYKQLKRRKSMDVITLHYPLDDDEKCVVI